MQAKQREMAENAWTVVMGFAPLSSFNWKFCKTVHQIHLLLARQSLGFRLQTSVVGQFFDLFFGWVGFWNVSKNQKAYYDERTNNLMQVSLWILWLFENQRLWWVKAGSSKTKNCCFFFENPGLYQGFILYTWPFSAGSFFEKRENCPTPIQMTHINICKQNSGGWMERTTML